MKFLNDRWAYEDADFDDEFNKKVNAAEELWRDRIKAWTEVHDPNVFFLVGGGGIAVRYLGFRKRIATFKIILSPPADPSNRLAWMESGEDIAKHLKTLGIECHLDLGRDD